jgi:structural maintenance of chromosome 2
MEALKQTISGFKTAVENAKDKQRSAKEECKKLEKDMDEFKNNKEGKIDELKVCICCESSPINSLIRRSEI